MNPEGRIDWEQTKYKIEWKDEFSVGVKGLDDQHKMLIRIINSFTTAVRNNKGRSHIEKTLESLTEYTVLHFVAEEVLMGAVGYPFLDDHKEKHNGLVTQINDFKTRVLEGEYISNQEMLQFLYGWLIGHIQKEDLKCTELYAAKGLH